MKYPASSSILFQWIVLLCFFACSVAKSVETPKFTADGFTVPQPRPTFEFPRDHGAHPDFKIEWWYITGHLTTTEDQPRRFGFQATFFRNAAPRDLLSKSTGDAPPSFGHDQIYLAHMALIDVQTGRFLHQERLNRAGWNASASTRTLDVVNGDWSLRMTGEGETMKLTGGVKAEASFSLTLSPLKPLVLFGDGGYSRKGPAPTAASYYLTYSRLAANGELTLGGVQSRVTGTAWMDHEISSSQLDKDQVGWDWLSVQFKDGRELMFYALRKTDGSFDPASSLTWIDRDGKATRANFRWEPVSRWTSPRSGASYPSRIRLTTTDPADSRERVFLIEPLHPDQELGGDLGGVTYWEGACRVVAENGEEAGSAYMELTGYDRAIEVLR